MTKGWIDNTEIARIAKKKRGTSSYKTYLTVKTLQQRTEQSILVLCCPAVLNGWQYQLGNQLTQRNADQDQSESVMVQSGSANPLSLMEPGTVVFYKLSPLQFIKYVKFRFFQKCMHHTTLVSFSSYLQQLCHG